MPIQSNIAGHSGPAAKKAAFLITIDTEGDNQWGRSHSITTRNSAFVPRFQAICEQYKLKPTYLVNWEMANCPVFVEFARDVLRRGAGEIGMHLHAWNSPPEMPLTDDDYMSHPYLIEFSEPVIREKVKVMTSTLEEVFQRDIVGHRAGRWAFNEIYARALMDNGYHVDCSVTPHLSWKKYMGDPKGAGGCDYTRFQDHAYFLDPHDISRPGTSSLLEVPMTVAKPLCRGVMVKAAKLLGRTSRFGARVERHFFPACLRLVPNGRNFRHMFGLLDAAVQDRRDHVEFTLHSSELMPGGSHNFPTESSIESLYEHLSEFFSRVSNHFSGMTLAEYYTRFVNDQSHALQLNASAGAAI
jgi:hypothetical protein